MKDERADSSYATLFRQQVTRSAAYSLARVQATSKGLSADDRDAALHSLSYALALSSAWPAARDLLLALAPLMEAAGFRDEWSRYLARGVEVARARGDATAEAELHWHLGVLHQAQAAYNDARQALEASAALFSRLQAARQEARALNRLAYVARRQRRSDEAEALVARAFSLLAPDDCERAYGLLVLGSVCLDRNRPADAAAHFRAALAALGPTPDPRERAWNLSNLGLALWQGQQPDQAAECYRQAIRLYETEAQDSAHMALAQLNLGILLLESEPEESLRLSLAARETLHAVGDVLRLAKVCNNIAIALTNLRRWGDAAVALETSLGYWDRIGDPLGRADTLDTLAQLHVARGDYTRAAAVYERAERELASLGDIPETRRMRDTLAAQRRQVDLQLAGAERPQGPDQPAVSPCGPQT